MNIVLSILLWITYFLSLYFSVFWFLVFLDSNFDLNRKKRKVRLKQHPFISIIIPAYNEEATIIPTIKSVINLSYPDEKYEIIVVNDGSKDSTLQKIRRFKARSDFRNLIILDQENQGKARTLNNALKIVKGEFFACLDADSFVERDTLLKMLKVYEKNRDNSLSIVTPFMKIKDSERLVHKLQYIEYLVSMFIARLMSFLDCLYIAPGPFSLYRTSIIRDLGGFDDSTLTEDQEIAYRAQYHNLKLQQCPDAYVHTVGPSTFRSLYSQRNRWFKGGLENFWKYRSIFLKRSYGDFGIAQMSFNILAFFLCSCSIFFFSYYFIIPLLKTIKNLFLVNFDIMPYLTGFQLAFNPLNINLEKSFILYLLFIISFLILYLAHKNAGEKIKKKGYIYLVPYFLIYYLILAFIAVIAMVELAINKKQKW